jgi:hypothetical protein
MVLILEEFSTVQEEADKIDNMLNTLSLQVRISSSPPFLTHILSWLKKIPLSSPYQFVWAKQKSDLDVDSYNPT